MTACTSYKQIELVEVAHHDWIQVTTADGKSRDVLDPIVDADSIRGLVQIGRTAAGSRESPWSVALDQVTEIKAASNPVGLGLLEVGLVGLSAPSWDWN
jgi:hypothetical protein